MNVTCIITTHSRAGLSLEYRSNVLGHHNNICYLHKIKKHIYIIRINVIYDNTKQAGSSLENKSAKRSIYITSN